MELILFRHGIAVDRDSPEAPAEDGDRPLTKLGRKRTELAAWGLRRLDVDPRRVYTSPFVRARQTTDILAKVFGLPEAAIVETPTLILARDPAEFRAEVAAETRRTVVVIGHNPHLEALAAALMGATLPEPLELKKAGAACFDLPAGPNKPGTLRWLLQPKMLRVLGKRWLDSSPRRPEERSGARARRGDDDSAS